jgi:hypothetical protein
MTRVVRGMQSRRVLDERLSVMERRGESTSEGSRTKPDFEGIVLPRSGSAVGSVLDAERELLPSDLFGFEHDRVARFEHDDLFGLGDSRFRSDHVGGNPHFGNGHPSRRREGAVGLTPWLRRHRRARRWGRSVSSSTVS